MKKMVALFAAVSLISSVAVLAGPTKNKKPAKPAKPATKTAKLVDVWHCPITGEEIKDKKTADKGVVVGSYRVHFCCGGCPETFAKLNDKDKKAKAMEAAKKDVPAKKAG